MAYAMSNVSYEHSFFLFQIWVIKMWLTLNHITIWSFGHCFCFFLFLKSFRAKNAFNTTQFSFFLIHSSFIFQILWQPFQGFNRIFCHFLFGRSKKFLLKVFSLLIYFQLFAGKYLTKVVISHFDLK